MEKKERKSFKYFIEVTAGLIAIATFFGIATYTDLPNIFPCKNTGETILINEKVFSLIDTEDNISWQFVSNTKDVTGIKYQDCILSHGKIRSEESSILYKSNQLKTLSIPLNGKYNKLIGLISPKEKFSGDHYIDVIVYNDESVELFSTTIDRYSGEVAFNIDVSNCERIYIMTITTDTDYNTQVILSNFILLK